MTKVFVNGTFDILHCGHVELLSYAKSLGDYLLVALDEDERVKQLKGPSRPINQINSRLYMMNALKPVDEVCSFSNELELETIIKKYSPDCMVVGGDYRGKRIIGSQWAKDVLFFERIDEYSTSAIVQGIKEK